MAGTSKTKQVSASARRNQSDIDSRRSWRSDWHRIVTICLVVLFLIMGALALYLLLTVSRGMSIHKLDNEVARLATTMYFDKLTAVAQVTMALLGAIWAFQTVVDSHVRLRGWHVMTCFALTNLSFAFSLIVHYWYGYDFIVSRMFHHLTFDIDAPFVQFISDWQLLFFLFGCLSLVLTISFGTRRVQT